MSIGSWPDSTDLHFMRSNATGRTMFTPDGALWNVTYSGGLFRFDGNHFFRLTQRDGLPAGVITCISVAPDGRIWFGTAQGIVVRFDGQSFTYFDASSELTRRQGGGFGRQGQGWDIQHGWDGATWCGTADRLWRFEEDTFRRYSTADGLPADGVSALLTTPDVQEIMRPPAPVSTPGSVARPRER
jgi:hypothetical protein